MHPKRILKAAPMGLTTDMAAHRRIDTGAREACKDITIPAAARVMTRFPHPTFDGGCGDWAVPRGGTVVYSEDGLVLDASSEDWEALQTKASASDRAQLIRATGPGTGAVQNFTPPALPTGQRCLIMGIALRVSYGELNTKPGFTAFVSYVDDYGATRQTAPVLLYPGSSEFETFLTLNYLTGKRLTPALGELIGAATPQNVTVTVDSIPATAGVEVIAVTASILSAFRGQY